MLEESPRIRRMTPSPGSGRCGLRAARRVLLAACVWTTPVCAQAEAAAADVRAREIAFAKTMADRDLAAFLTFLDPEAVFFNGNEPLRGRDAIESAWAPFFDGPVAPFSWHPEVVEVLGSGDLALTSGPVRSASGEEVGRFNSVWRRNADGGWLVVFDKGS
ncbi:MAG: nuclear transport factor 2 family protein [Gemmatimonadota bacterium]